MQLKQNPLYDTTVPTVIEALPNDGDELAPSADPLLPTEAAPDSFPKECRDLLTKAEQLSGRGQGRSLAVRDPRCRKRFRSCGILSSIDRLHRRACMPSAAPSRRSHSHPWFPKNPWKSNRTPVSDLTEPFSSVPVFSREYKLRTGFRLPTFAPQTNPAAAGNAGPLLPGRTK